MRNGEFLPTAAFTAAAATAAANDNAIAKSTQKLAGVPSVCQLSDAFALSFTISNERANPLLSPGHTHSLTSTTD